MVVKVFYDDGRSWIAHTINPPIPDEPNTISTYTNAYGFVLPLDSMDMDTDLTCRFGCEENGQLCSWCIATGQDFAGRIHKGLDICWSGIGGTSIRAVKAGYSDQCNDYGDEYGSGWGNWIKIQHAGGLSTLYAHMQAHTSVSGNVKQGDIVGKVGSTGLAFGDHLHFEVYNSNDVRVDPEPYLQGASKFVPPITSPKTYKIVDGPLTLRAPPSTSSTSYGTLTNGTSVQISGIEYGGNYIFGKISSGNYSGKWIAVGTVSGDIYAANVTDKWVVVDGPIYVRQSASTSSTNYGLIANGSTFKITNAIKSGNYIFGQISASTNPSLASGSTCSIANAKGHWVALDYCSIT